jgi:hypothetical protein
MTAAVSPTFLRTSACVIISVYNLLSWGAIIKETFGKCDAYFHILCSVIVESDYDMNNNFFQLTVSNAQQYELCMRLLLTNQITP